MARQAKNPVRADVSTRQETVEEKVQQFIRKHESSISIALGVVVVLIGAALLFRYIRMWQARNVERLSSGTSEEVTPTPAAVTQLPNVVELEEKEGVAIPKGLPTVYEVQKGDSSWKIAEAFYGSGYNYVDIEKENNLQHNQHLEIGMKLNVPGVTPKTATKLVPMGVSADPPTPENHAQSEYTVQRGDSLWTIAVARYNDGYRWPEIYALNKKQVKNPNIIVPGMILNLPEK